MGAGRIGPAVADAGPLIHLTEIGGFSLLRIFETLHIPDAVWLETIEAGWVQEAKVLALGNTEQHTMPGAEVTGFVQEHSLQHLRWRARVPAAMSADRYTISAHRRLGCTQGDQELGTDPRGIARCGGQGLSPWTRIADKGRASRRRPLRREYTLCHSRDCGVGNWAIA